MKFEDNCYVVIVLREHFVPGFFKIRKETRSKTRKYDLNPTLLLCSFEKDYIAICMYLINNDVKLFHRIWRILLYTQQKWAPLASLRY